MTHCPYCLQPISRDGVCSFCSPPRKEGYSASGAVRRYLILLGRSAAPALDPSQADTRGGSVGPVPYCLHERARIGAVLTFALGDEWMGTETGRALVAYYSPSDWRHKKWLSELPGDLRWEWDRLCQDGLGKIRKVLESRGLCKEYDEEEQEEIVREVVRGWEDIADYLGFSTKTVQAWYSGKAKDPCNIRQIVQKIGNRVVAAYKDELEKARDLLYSSSDLGE